ncbi:MAG: hypothetical protein ACOX3V_08060 [Bacillota bacterium]
MDRVSSSHDHDHSTLLEASGYRTSGAIGQLVTKALKALPRDCSSEMMTAAVRKVLPNAVVISAAEARKIKTIDDAIRLLPRNSKAVFETMPYMSQEDVLETLRIVVNGHLNLPTFGQTFSPPPLSFADVSNR